MRYEVPMMDIMYLNETCVIATSSIKDGVFGKVDKDYENISGDEF
jgi:hypothetical protein